MSWTLVKRWLATIPERNAVRDLLSPAPNLYGAATLNGRFDTLSATVVEAGDRPRKGERMWRRRALMRKGALLYSKATLSGTFISLAMLDEDGVVIGWYESANHWDGAERSPTESHVSQLYTATDTALGVPIADLRAATIHGESVQTGWRVGIDGRTFWARTTIRAVLLRDGRLQGFSHLTEHLPTLWRIPNVPTPWPWKWPFHTSRAYELPRRATNAPARAHPLTPGIRETPA